MNPVRSRICLGANPYFCGRFIITQRLKLSLVTALAASSRMNIFEKIFNKKPAKNGQTAEEKREEEFEVQTLKDRLATQAGWLEQAERQGDKGVQAQAHERIRNIEQQLLDLGVPEEEIEQLTGREMEVAA